MTLTWEDHAESKGYYISLVVKQLYYRLYIKFNSWKVDIFYKNVFWKIVNIMVKKNFYTKLHYLNIPFAFLKEVYTNFNMWSPRTLKVINVSFLGEVYFKK